MGSQTWWRPPRPISARRVASRSLPFGGPLLVAPTPAPKTPQLTLDVETIEVAAARDHIPLRAAQPCVVLAAFAIEAGAAHGIGRTVYRFKPPASLPASLVGSQRLLDVPGLVRLTAAEGVRGGGLVEENGGSDVQQLYQALADAHDLSFWARTESCPAPVTLPECAAAVTFANAAHRVEELQHGKTLADLVRDDTYAGAALGCFELTQTMPERQARFHTAAEGRKNDWLMTLRCRIV